MKKYLVKIRDLQLSNMFYVLFGIQILFLIAYVHMNKSFNDQVFGEQNGSLQGTLGFIISNSGYYLKSSVVGILAWFSWIITGISIVGNIPLIKMFFDVKSDDVPNIKYIINCIVCVSFCIANGWILNPVIFIVALIIFMIGIILMMLCTRSSSY